MNEKIAMVLMTCDSYFDVAQHFFPILKMFWKDFDLKCFVVNDQLNAYYGYEKETIINCGENKPWTERLQKALEIVQEEYILFMMEDYFLGKEIENDTFNSILDYAIDNSIDYIDLRNHLHYKGKSIDGFKRIPCNVLYGMSLQASIWRKSYLLSIIKGQKCSAWEVENIFNKKVQTKGKGYIENCLSYPSNLFNIQNGVIKGKWDKSVLKFYKKRSYVIKPEPRGLLPRKDKARMTMFRLAYKIFPTSFIRWSKRLLKKIGFKFTTE